MDINNYNIWQEKYGHHRKNTNQELLEKEEGGVIFPQKKAGERSVDCVGGGKGLALLVMLT